MNGLQKVVLGLAVVLAAAGAGGMVLSLFLMTNTNAQDIVAGAAGFIAGALFVAGALIAAAIVVTSHDG